MPFLSPNQQRQSTVNCLNLGNCAYKHTDTHSTQTNYRHTHTRLTALCLGLPGWCAGVVICLEWGADLRMAQLMPLPLTVSSIKSRLVLPFWYQLTWAVPDKGPLNGVCYIFGRVLILPHGLLVSLCSDLPQYVQHDGHSVSLLTTITS